MIPLVNPALARQSSAAVQPWLGGALRWIVVVLALVATADAAYLTWTSFTHGVVVGCDGMGHGDCDDVLASRWSRVAGLPVALGGLLCYGTILALGLVAGSRGFNANRWLGTVLAAAALLAALTGLWFTLLQVFVLGVFCDYCIGIHLCGLVIAGLVLWPALGKEQHQSAASRSHVAMAAAIPGARRSIGPRPAEGPSLAAAAPVAGILLALLIAAQVMFPPKTFEVSTPELPDTIDMTAAADASTAEPDKLSPSAQPHVVNRPTVEEAARDDDKDDSGAEPIASRKSEKTADVAADEPPAAAAPELSRELTLLGGKLKLDTYKELVLGSPDAKYVVVEMMDYTCPHCREMHAHIRDAMYRYGDQLAVIILPVPLELECNKFIPATDPIHRGSCKISKTTLALAEVDPSKFLDFHNFLLAEEEKPPTAAQAVVRAFRLVDPKELRRVGSTKEMGNRIQNNIRLFSTLSAQHRGEKTFGLPVQIVGDTVLSGKLTSEEMFEAWEKALGMKPL